MASFIPLITNAERAIIGYYPHWIKGELSPESLDLNILTHVIHAFAWPNDDGTLSMYEGMSDMSLNHRIHQKDREILISIGGWGNSSAFTDVLGDASLRSTLITNIVGFIVNQNYDGVDIDWEFPASETDKENLTLFVSDLRSALDTVNEGYLLTMAVSSGNWFGQWFDYDNLRKHCDWFNIMTYDFHGSWSTHSGHNSPMISPQDCNDGSIETASTYLRDTRGIPSSQLVLGIPFFGKMFNSEKLYYPFTGDVKDMKYNEISSLINLGWSRIWDNYSQVPYLLNNNNSQLITYDDSVSVAIKTENAINDNLLGVMIWAIGQDIINGRQPLLEAVGESIRSISLHKEHNYPKTFRLYNSYPNPFNANTTIQFRIPHVSILDLEILDINGRLVERLFSGKLGPGAHYFDWIPGHLSSGIYITALRLKDQIITNKLLYIK